MRRCAPRPTAAGLDFNRPPRLLRPQRLTRFQLPAPPPEADRRPLPLLMAAVPLVMGVGMALLLHQVYLLAMAGLSPLMLVGSYFSERSNGRKCRRPAAGGLPRAQGPDRARCPRGAGGREGRPARPVPGPGHGVLHRLRAAAPAVGTAPQPIPIICCCGWEPLTCRRRSR